MRENINLGNSKEWLMGRIFLFLTYILALFPILTYGLRSIITILWLITSVWCFSVAKKKLCKKNNFYDNRKLYIRLLATISPYILLVFSLTYSENISEGAKNLVQMVSLLVFPVGLFLSSHRLNGDHIKKVQILFISAVVILVVYQIIHSLLNLNLLLGDLTNEELKVNGLLDRITLTNSEINKIKIRRFRKFISTLIDTHPTYQAMWIGFSLYLLIKKLINNLRFKYTFTYIFIIIVLLSWMLLISSRMPLVAGCIAIMVVVYIGSFGFKTKVITTLGVLLFSLLSYHFIDTIKVRVNQVFDTGISTIKLDDKVTDFNSVNIRNGIYYCGSKIAANNLLFGVGIGDTQELLNECLINEVNPKIYSWRDYNSHNQYLSFILDSGIIGLVLFVFSLIMGFYVAIKNRDIDYLFFMTFISMVFLTENMLVRNDGILFYAIFNSLFLFVRENNKSAKKI